MERVRGLNWEVYRAHVQKFSLCTLVPLSYYLVACLIRFYHIHLVVQHMSMYHVPDRTPALTRGWWLAVPAHILTVSDPETEVASAPHSPITSFRNAGFGLAWVRFLFCGLVMEQEPETSVARGGVGPCAWYPARTR